MMSQRTHRHRILLVEDHDELRKAVAELLELEGYETVEASDGYEALQALRDGPTPCVVLLDLHLPKLSGQQFRSHQLLDQAARSSKVTRALSASSADYLRALSCRSWRRQATELDLPGRLASRLGEAAERHLARLDLLESAVRWETASLLCERTMANWGRAVVLGGFR